MFCFIVIFGLALWAGLASGGQKQTEYGDTQPVSIKESSPTTVISTTEVVWQMLGQVNQGRVLDDLSQLAGEAPICVGSVCYTITNRLTGSESLRWATDYIYTELVNLGYSVEFQNWSHSGHTDRNVVARKTGVISATEKVYFVAHVDGVGTGNERFPAVDDNASGAVDILEVARIFSSHSFSRTLVLLFSTGEEQGTLGVKSYLDQLSPTELSSIKYAINIDMVGYDPNGDGGMELWHGGHLPSLALAAVMSDTISAYRLDLAPRFVVGCG